MHVKETSSYEFALNPVVPLRNHKYAEPQNLRDYHFTEFRNVKIDW